MTMAALVGLWRDIGGDKPLGLGRERRSFFLGSWVEPELVAKITYSTWTADSLLRHTAYVGLRKDKAADQVRREPLG